MSKARDMIEAEYGAMGASASWYASGVAVIERLLSKIDSPDRREYTARLDRMVGTFIGSPLDGIKTLTVRELLVAAKTALESIDAAVAEKYGEVEK